MDIGVVSLLTFFQGFLQYILGVARITHTKKVFVVNTAVIIKYLSSDNIMG